MKDMVTFIHDLRSMDKLMDIDLAFASFIYRMVPHTDKTASLMLLAALISNSVSQRKETALPAERIRTRQSLAGYLDVPQEELPVTSDNWLPSPADFPEIISSGKPEVTLLVCFHDLWYLGRSFQSELFLKDYIKKHMAPVSCEAVDFGKLTTLQLEKEQRNAVELAQHSKFLVISGGPGTGKTTIVSMILALREEPPQKIILCAPTGKAQMRMKQSLNKQLHSLLVPEEKIRDLSSIQASTIHRLLRWDPSAGTFRFNKRNPLPYSLIIVDECSMIPLSLMVSLLDAVPQNASVILLGDRYQLSSVEPGSVFGDFCEILRQHPDHFAELTVSRRFVEGGGICILKDRINRSEAQSAWDFLSQNQDPQISCFKLPQTKELPKLLLEQCTGTWITGGKRYYESETLDDAWRLFEDFRILTPVNFGPYGVGELNELMMSVLDLSAAHPKAGEPFLILKNDYQVNLFNGDTGMLWYADDNGNPLPRSAVTDPVSAHKLVFFPEITPDGQDIWRGIPLSYLPEHQNAFAFTIHKSQGSDYTRILLLLPENDKDKKIDFLTREILYTGITRAKEHVSVASNEHTFVTAASLAVARASGLKYLCGE